jgi:hypothetical protein
MVARLSALRAARPLPPVIILVLISVRGWVDPRAIVQQEGLLQWSSNLGVGQSTNKLFPPQNEHVWNFTTGIGQLSSSHEHRNEFLVPGSGRKDNSSASARCQTLVIQTTAYHYIELSLLCHRHTMKDYEVKVITILNHNKTFRH